jgi:hypothetical protein
MTPVRVLDTRPGTGPIGVPAVAKIGPDSSIDLQLAGGAAPLPVEATAAVINVTIDQTATEKSFLTIWPAGQPRPLSSANNAEPTLVASNQMVARLGSGGAVSIYNQTGSIDLVIDVVGYMLPLDVAAAASGITGVPGPKGDKGDKGDTGLTGVAGPGAQLLTITPSGGSACATDGKISVNSLTGDISVCAGTTWTAPINLHAATVSSSYADSLLSAAVDLDDGTLATVATFTAPNAGDYRLEGDVTVGQTSTIGLAVLMNAACAWYESDGTTLLGPVNGASLPAQLVVGTAAQMSLSAEATATLGAGDQALLRCQINGASITAGDYKAQSWAYTATQTS